MPALQTATLLALASGGLLADDEPKKPTPKIEPDKAVTFVTEPFDADSYIDCGARRTSN